MLYCISVLTSISGAWEQRQGEANNVLKSHSMISNVGSGPYGFINLEQMFILASTNCSSNARIKSQY